MKALKILALDQATITGWATDTASGTWNLKVNRGESEGMRVVRFKGKVRELIDLEGINLIAYERPAGRFKASIIVSAEMIGVLKDLCIERNIDLACYSAKEIKKHATGNGNAGKPLMLSSAREKWPNVLITDDNEADALWLLDLVKKDLNVE